MGSDQHDLREGAWERLGSLVRFRVRSPAEFLRMIETPESNNIWSQL